MLLTTRTFGKHHFTDKSSAFSNIIIVEKDWILDRNEEIANTFYDFYSFKYSWIWLNIIWIYVGGSSSELWIDCVSSSMSNWTM